MKVPLFPNHRKLFPTFAEDEKEYETRFKEVFPSIIEDQEIISTSSCIDPEVEAMDDGRYRYGVHHSFESLYFVAMSILMEMESSLHDNEQIGNSIMFLESVADHDSHVAFKLYHLHDTGIDSITKLLPRNVRFLADLLHQWRNFVCMEWSLVRTKDGKAISPDILFRAQLIILYKICLKIHHKGDITFERGPDLYKNPRYLARRQTARLMAASQSQASHLIPAKQKK